MYLFFICKKCGTRNRVVYDGKGGTFRCIGCSEPRTFKGTQEPKK